MAYCTHCGREIHDHCVCLQGNPISKKAALFIYLLTAFVPMTIFIHVRSFSIWQVHYQIYGALSLSIVLIALTLLEVLAKSSYLALFFGCHQSVNRTIHLRSRPLPLCARCLGIYLGVFLSFFISLIHIFPFYVYLLLAIPLLIDGIGQKKKLWVSTNSRRFFTGLLFSNTLVFVYSLFYVFLISVMDSIYYL
jgi:uncharacterized membrane protein